MQCIKRDEMTLGENRRSVAEEGEMSRAAATPAAIMRSGSRVYKGGLLHNLSRSSVVRMGRGGAVLCNCLFMAERSRELGTK